jgi:CDP-glucose 4,6-dehydratase
MTHPPDTTTNWQGRKVFLTGHTGFKGSWLALMLASKGAVVRGYALDPITVPALFNVARIGSLIEVLRGDIRNPTSLEPAMQDFAPEVVFHLAAQPLVRFSYQDPIGTYETNVIGTARVLDCVRRTPSVRAVVSVTTDKCYENKEWIWPYRETDPLGGYDPYSSSKACAEIVSAAYRQSFFPTTRLGEHKVALATARAGNVIGGGDWSTDRLLPDLIRGFLSGEPVRIRHPRAIRPWQHVLDPLQGYIRLAEQLLTHDPKYATAYNFGPSDKLCAKLAGSQTALGGNRASWLLDESAAQSPHEAGYLKLDASRAKADLDWSPQLPLETALEWLVQWYLAWHSGADMHVFTLAQIATYNSLLRSPAAQS